MFFTYDYNFVNSDLINSQTTYYIATAAKAAVLSKLSKKDLASSTGINPV